MRRTIVVATSALLAAAASAVAAQSYPVKPVRLVVHIGAGSSLDIVARVLAQKVGETCHNALPTSTARPLHPPQNSQ
jgi:tripartite-type tricarboxylate transporter receptor subunit TctC